MTIPVNITFRHMESSAAVETRMSELAAHLGKFSDRIQSCRVVVDSPHRHHHQGKVFNVKVQLGTARRRRRRRHGTAESRRPRRHLCGAARCVRRGEAQVQQRMSACVATRPTPREKPPRLIESRRPHACRLQSMMTVPLLFAPLATRSFAGRMAAALGIGLAPLEEREYEGGEHKIRPLVAVRGRNVYVVQSLSGDAVASANDRLVRVAVPDRGTEGRRRRARHGMRAVPGVCPQGSSHEGARSRQFPIRRPVVRGHRRLSRHHARRAQRRRVRERVSLQRRSARSRAARCRIDRAAGERARRSPSCRPISAAPSGLSECRTSSRCALTRRSIWRCSKSAGRAVSSAANCWSGRSKGAMWSSPTT